MLAVGPVRAALAAAGGGDHPRDEQRQQGQHGQQYGPPSPVDGGGKRPDRIAQRSHGPNCTRDPPRALRHPPHKPNFPMIITCRGPADRTSAPDPGTLCASRAAADAPECGPPARSPHSTAGSGQRAAGRPPYDDRTRSRRNPTRARGTHTCRPVLPRPPHRTASRRPDGPTREQPALTPRTPSLEPAPAPGRTAAPGSPPNTRTQEAQVRSTPPSRGRPPTQPLRPGPVARPAAPPVAGSTAS
ncbi:hypothetical protein BX257_5152 [Streptomyces sp. 3212.3]|nr:hypothetical protein BX257_5152 [Streptomyces sp. 3212.3]